MHLKKHNRKILAYSVCLLLTLLLSAFLLCGLNTDNGVANADGDKVISFNITLNQKIYNNQSQYMDYTALLNGSPAGNLTNYYVVTYSFNGQTISAPLNAGVYSVNFTLSATGESQGYSIDGGSFNTTFIINQRTINISDSGISVDTKVYDASNIAIVTAGSYSYSNTISGDNVNVGTEATFLSADAGEHTVNINYTIGGPNSGNYTLSKNTATATGVISKRQLVLSSSTTFQAILSNISKTYDGTYDYPYIDGPINNPIIGGINKVFIKVAYSDVNAGSYDDIAVELLLNNDTTSYNEDNYILMEGCPDTANGTITPKKLNADPSKIDVTKTKVYDGTSVASFILSEGFIGGFLTGEEVDIDVSANFSSANVGGSHTITVSFTTFTPLLNYAYPDNLIFSGGAIDRRQIVIEGEEISLTKIWDNTTQGVVANKGVIANLAYGDTVNFTTTATFNSSSIGADKTIVVTYSISGAQANNYIAPATYIKSGGEIVKRPLIINLPELVTNKIYDGNNLIDTVGNITYSNRISPYNNVFLTVTASYSDANAGEDKIIHLDYVMTGEHSLYYDLPTTTTLSGSISKKPLIVTLAPSVVTHKEYDGTTYAEIISMGEISGILISDQSTLFINAEARYNSPSTGGGKIITLTYELYGDSADNYILDSQYDFMDCSIGLSNYIIELLSAQEYEYTGAEVDPRSMIMVRINNEPPVDNSNYDFIYQYYDNLLNPISPPSAPGAYYVKVRFSDKSHFVHYKDLSDEDAFIGPMLFNITQAEIVDVAFNNLTIYNGEDSLLYIFNTEQVVSFISEDITIKNGNGINMDIFDKLLFTYEYFNGVSYSVVASADIVGVYRITVSLSATHYPDVSEYFNNLNSRDIATVTLNIVARDLTIGEGITIINNRYVYGDGLEHNLIIETNPPGIMYEILYYLNEDRTTPIHDRSQPNTYIAVITITDPNYSSTEIEYELIVDKRTAIITIDNLIHTYGSSLMPTIIALYDYNAIDTDFLIKFYSTSEGRYIDGMPVNAGIYLIEITIDDQLYKGYTSDTYTVEKAVLTVSFNRYEMIYSGQSPTIALVYDGFMYGDTADSLAIKPTVNTTNIKNANTYSGIKASGGASSNYTFNNVEGEIVISKKNLFISIKPNLSMLEGGSFSLNDYNNYNYDGLVTGDYASNIFGGNPPLLRVKQGDSVISSLQNAAAGIYTLELYGGNSLNYNLVFSSTQSFTILSNSISDANSNVIISGGNFNNNSTVNFITIANNTDTFKSNRNIAVAYLNNKDIKYMYSVNVSDSVAGSYTVRIKAPQGMDDGIYEVVYIADSEARIKSYEIIDGYIVLTNIPNLDCYILLTAPKNNTLLYAILIIIGVVSLLGGLIVLKKISSKKLPQAVKVKGEATMAMPDINSVDTEDEFSFSLSDAIEVSKEQDDKTSDNEIVQETVGDRLMNMAKAKLIEELNEKTENNNAENFKNNSTAHKKNKKSN